MTTDDVLQRLADEAELRDLIHRYAFGLDTEDWELWRSVFADQVAIDLTDFQPGPIPEPIDADIHVRGARRLFANLDASQHFIGTHRFEIDGDRAVIKAHMRAEHWLSSGEGGDRYTMFGTYTDECIRTPDGWKMTRVKLALLHQEGNRHLMHLALTRRPTDQGKEHA